MAPPPGIPDASPDARQARLRLLERAGTALDELCERLARGAGHADGAAGLLAAVAGLMHQLKGSLPTWGFVQLGEQARCAEALVAAGREAELHAALLALRSGLASALVRECAWEMAPRAQAGPGAGSCESCPRHLVCIEDDPDIALLVSLALGDACDVEIVPDGMAGWERLQRDPRPAAVVLDLTLPGLGGAEVLERVRAEPRFADLPVLVLSARFHSDEHARALAPGATRVLRKPFAVADLVSTVRGLLGCP